MKAIQKFITRLWNCSYAIGKMVAVILGIITMLWNLAANMPALQSCMMRFFQEVNSWFVPFI